MARKTGNQRAGSPPGAKQAGSSLGITIFVVICILVLTTAGAAVVSTLLFGDQVARERLEDDIERSYRAQAFVQLQRDQQLELTARTMIAEGELVALLGAAVAPIAEERDTEAILARLDEYQSSLIFTLAVVLDNEGRVVARTDDPGAAGEDFSANPLLARAIEEREADGIWVLGENLHHAKIVQVVRNFDLIGFLVLAQAVDELLADQVKRTSGAEITFLADSPTGWATAASTLDRALAGELIAELRRLGFASDRIRTGVNVELNLAGQACLAFLVPLRDAGGQTVGAMVALTPLAEHLAGFRRMRLILCGVAGGCLVVGLILALLVGHGALRPVRRLAAAAAEASAGNYDVTVPDVGGSFASLAGSVARLASVLREKQILEAFAGQAARHLPPPARTETESQRPRTAEMAFVVVEMRRFVNPKIGHDPEENLRRFDRDLKRITGLVGSRQGSVEAVYGHRIMAAFEGDEASFRALSAATEALLLLSQREDAFDEPVPPVVAVGRGSVVTGPVIWSGRSGTVMAGMPVQQLESLLREAAPGEVYLTKSVAAALAPRFQQAGIELKSQRGLLSPQPLYVLNPEVAAKLTGVEVAAPKPAALVAPGAEKRSLADLAPGLLLAGRFKIQAELGRGAMGMVFKAEDGDRGDLVTMKMLRPEVVADGERFERLRQVIRQARMLSHPNVLGVVDFGKADGLPFICSQFEYGMTLRWILSVRRQVGLMNGFLLLRQLCQGLAAAWREHLVHGGVKPENVLVDATGHLWVMDFGHRGPVRDPNAILAGAPYLAPEQLEGGTPDSRGDVYACGAVVYEMLTGQVPVAGRTPAEIRQAFLERDPAPPSTLNQEIPPALDRVIMKCLAQGAGQRFASVAELIAALEALRG